MEQIRTVLIVPTYNNEKTIAKVLKDIGKFNSDIIVVNDGSTDKTGEILSRITGIILIEFPINRGKGAALRAALERASSDNFTHAITIDADGQHLAQDIPLFMRKIKEEPQTLWIGERSIPVQGGLSQPTRSRLGKKFGAFWYKFYTGVKITDTQSGFRAYPLNSISSLQLEGNRYEFEIEVLIIASWAKIPVKSIPIHLLYLPFSERVSHFRPVRDFLRISKVNSRAALTKIFFPSSLVHTKGLGLREKIKNTILNELRANTTPNKAAQSIAVGVFMAITPTHGFQVIILLALSILLRLNRPLALLGISISSAPLLPFWIAAGLGIGKIVVPSQVISALIDSCKSYPLPGFLSRVYRLSENGFLLGFVQWVIGSVVLAVICGAASYFIALPLFKSIRKAKDQIKRENQ